MKSPQSESASYEFTFTVFIPTYNRSYILERALSSLKSQTFKDFEVLIIDDGSMDNTRELVSAWQQSSDFPIRYYWQENQGKHAAHNYAVKLSKGFLFVTLDSDDMLTPNALEILKTTWDSIPEKEREAFAGVEGLCAELDGKVAGNFFPADVSDANYLEMHKLNRLRGDKKNAIRTTVLRRFPYPRFEGERHVRPSLILERMAHQFKFRYINEVIQVVEYQADGLTNNRFRLRMKNPKGFRLYHLEEVNFYASFLSPKDLYRNNAKFVRYSLHSGIGFIQQSKEVKAKALWLLSIPRGTIGWAWDKVKLALKSPFLQNFARVKNFRSEKSLRN